jgi:hypothetical protein
MVEIGKSDPSPSGAQDAYEQVESIAFLRMRDSNTKRFACQWFVMDGYKKT